MSVLAAVLLLSTATAQTPAQAQVQPTAQPAVLRGPIRMKASQIKAYNKDLPKDHPAYIRCESQAVTGSIAMRNKVCRTNSEWTKIIEQGNGEARKMVDDMNKGWTNGKP
jgi:hypothetical protein